MFLILPSDIIKVISCFLSLADVGKLRQCHSSLRFLFHESAWMMRWNREVEESIYAQTTSLHLERMVLDFNAIIENTLS